MGGWVHYGKESWRHTGASPDMSAVDILNILNVICKRAVSMQLWLSVLYQLVYFRCIIRSHRTLPRCSLLLQMLQWCGLCVLGWVHKHAVQKWIKWLCAGLGNRSCWPRKPLSNGGRNSPRGTFKGDICQPIEKYRDYEIVKVSLQWWGSLLPNYPGQKAGYSTCPVAFGLL